MQPAGVYILQSLKNGRYYVGSTKDIKRRIWEHNEGKVRGTKFLTPLQLKIFIGCKSLSEGRISEYRLKS